MAGSAAYYVGVDVGTGSARAGLVSGDGRVLCTRSVNLEVDNPRSGFYHQSTEQVWAAIETCVADVLKNANGGVKGIGFDATCSLVLVDGQGKTISISPDENPKWDVLMWLDHRAEEEAKFINAKAGGRSVLDYVGGGVSLEMQTPKLLWLKNNLPISTWSKVRHCFDLPDFLTWKAAGGVATRSLCSLVCKWTFEVGRDGAKKGWNKEYFRSIGLEELLQEDCQRLGQTVESPGTFVGNASADFLRNVGLPAGLDLPVGASMIDAHAGTLGMLACKQARLLAPVYEQLSLISGTSNCHMALSKHPIFVSGVWGPYFSAVMPGSWLLEGGQSAAGKLIDHVLQSHPAGEEANRAADARGMPVQQYVESVVLTRMKDNQKLDDVALITKDYHLYPDYHGNRSPLADPAMKGAICGLSLDTGDEDLAKAYLAAVQAIAYGTRHIMEEMKKQGQKISVAVICGGLSKSALFVQTHADVLGIPVVLPDQTESVLLGAAMLGAAAAAKGDRSFDEIVSSMEQPGREYRPDERLRRYHERKFAVFKKMGSDQIECRKIMTTD